MQVFRLLQQKTGNAKIVRIAIRVYPKIFSHADLSVTIEYVVFAPLNHKIFSLTSTAQSDIIFKGSVRRLP